METDWFTESIYDERYISILYNSGLSLMPWTVILGQGRVHSINNVIKREIYEQNDDRFRNVEHKD
jgi:hypothetical protein